MVKILMSMDGRFAIVEDGEFKVAGAIQCGSFLVMKKMYSAEMEIISDDEMDEIYNLLLPEAETEAKDHCYPCDIEDDNGEIHCPFGAGPDSSGELCRRNCGLGVDEDSYPTEEPEVDESMNPYDGTYDWENDRVMIGEDG